MCHGRRAPFPVHGTPSGPARRDLRRVHHLQGIAEDQTVLPAVQAFIRSADFRADTFVALAEQVQGLPAFGMPAFQGFQYRLGGQPLVDKQWEGLHRETATLSLAAPVEKVLRETFEFFRCLPSLIHVLAGENLPD